MKKRYKHKLFGVTLLEVMLVLAVFAMILLLVIRQYQVWLLDVEVQKVKANVNTLFGALANFYKANCYLTSQPTGTNNPNTGMLADRAMLVVSTGQPTGWLSLNPMEIYLKGYGNLNLVPTRLVEDGENSKKGYDLQFNLVTYPRAVNISPQAMSKGTAKTALPMAIVASWQAQVAIQLPRKIAKDPSMAEFYLALLGGNCLSSSSGGQVIPCSQGTAGTSDYIVWERMPSLATNDPDNWLVNPVVDQFNQAYQLYPSLYSVDNSGQIPQPLPGSQGNTQQIIFCGN